MDLYMYIVLRALNVEHDYATIRICAVWLVGS